MAKVIEGLYYSESHEYVRVEGEFGYIGMKWRQARNSAPWRA